MALQGHSKRNGKRANSARVRIIQEPLPRVLIRWFNERGTLHNRGGQMNYVDSSHWLSILNEIKEVGEQLSNTQTQEEPWVFDPWIGHDWNSWRMSAWESKIGEKDADLISSRPPSRDSLHISLILDPRTNKNGTKTSQTWTPQVRHRCCSLKSSWTLRWCCIYPLITSIKNAQIGVC